MFYGWWIVIAGSVSQAYASGAFWQGFGAFFDPIVAQFGWSRAITSSAVSLQRIESGMISPFVGWFIDRFGPRNVMLAGVGATGLGFIMLSRINSLWQLYLAFTVITVGLSFGTFLVVTATVANWFVTRRARAIAIMSAGSGLGGLLVPALVWLIAATDWRTGLVAVGIGFWVTGVPVALVMRSKPEDYGQLPDGHAAAPSDIRESAPQYDKSVESDDTLTEADYTAREALSNRAFWQLVIATGSGHLMISASVHQIPAMTSFGVSREVAALVLMSVSLVSLVGRIGSGFVGDALDKRHVMATAFGLQLIGTLIFAQISSNWHLLGFVLFWGIGFGASIPVQFAMLADYFGRRHYSTILGLWMTFGTIFGVVAPVFVGWMVDVRESYREPYLILGLSLLVSIPLVLTLKIPQPRPTVTPAVTP